MSESELATKNYKFLVGPAKLNSRERMIGWGGPGTRLLVALINKGQAELRIQ